MNSHEIVTVNYFSTCTLSTVCIYTKIDVKYMHINASQRANHLKILTSSVALGMKSVPKTLRENFMAFHILLQKCL